MYVRSLAERQLSADRRYSSNNSRLFTESFLVVSSTTRHGYELKKEPEQPARNCAQLLRTAWDLRSMSLIFLQFTLGKRATVIRKIWTDSGILTMSSPRANPCLYNTFITAAWSSTRSTSAVGHQATGRAHFCLPAKEGSWETKEGEDANSQAQRRSVRMPGFLRWKLKQRKLGN